MQHCKNDDRRIDERRQQRGSGPSCSAPRHADQAHDDGVFGTASDYKTLKVDEQGRASASANVPVVMPSDGRYFVSVGASEANAATIVACGNLASPTQ